MPNYVFDPGHGIPDIHNLGVSKKYYEHVGNLRVAKLLSLELKNDYNVTLTRTTDEGLSLTARANIAIANKADFFASIHSDANPDPNLRGVTVFRSVRYPESEDLGNLLGNAVAKAMGTNFRGVKTRPGTKQPGRDYYTIIDITATAGIKFTYIIERGFHTNALDEAKLRDDGVNSKVSIAISNVLKSYFMQTTNLKEEAELNEYIKQIQQHLANNGFNPGVIDGVPGPKTRDAVIVAIDAAKSSALTIKNQNTQISKLQTAINKVKESVKGV